MVNIKFTDPNGVRLDNFVSSSTHNVHTGTLSQDGNWQYWFCKASELKIRAYIPLEKGDWYLYIFGPGGQGFTEKSMNSRFFGNEFNEPSENYFYSDYNPGAISGGGGGEIVEVKLTPGDTVEIYLPGIGRGPGSSYNVSNSKYPQSGKARPGMNGNRDGTGGSGYGGGGGGKIGGSNLGSNYSTSGDSNGNPGKVSYKFADGEIYSDNLAGAAGQSGNNPQFIIIHRSAN